MIVRKVVAAAIAAGALLAMLAPAGRARADEAADRVLRDMDQAMSRFTDLTLEYDVINQEPGKAETTVAMSVRIKGDRRLLEVTPADTQPSKVLIESQSPVMIFMYFPKLNRAPRVGAHVLKQAFLGLAFTLNDLLYDSGNSYSASYEGTIAAQTPAELTLVLTPKAGNLTPYSKIEVTVAKPRMLPTQLKYFIDKGTHVKTETRTGYTRDGDVWTPGEQKMTDHTRNGAWTRLVVKSRKVNANLSDDVFTPRAMEN